MSRQVPVVGLSPSTRCATLQQNAPGDMRPLFAVRTQGRKGRSMAQYIAVLQSDPGLLPCLLGCLDPLVDFPSSPGHAVGLSYFENGKVLLRKRPVSACGVMLEQLAADVASEVLVAAVYATGTEGFHNADTQPYRFRNWTFAGAGRIVPFGERASVLDALPDFLRRGIIGQSDAELAFLITLSNVYQETRNLDLLDIEPELVSRALARTLAFLDDRADGAHTPRSRTCAVLTNGRMLATVRRGRPLFYALVEGLQSCKRCELDRNTTESDARTRPHAQMRGVVLSTRPSRELMSWIEVPDAHVLSVSRTLEIRLTPIG